MHTHQNAIIDDLLLDNVLHHEMQLCPLLVLGHLDSVWRMVQ